MAWSRRWSSAWVGAATRWKRSEIWQVPAEATPQVKSAVRVAGLRGRNLELVEHRVLRRLARAGIRLSRMVDDRKLARTIGLAELKAQAALEGMALVRRRNRLSVMPVSGDEWEYILAME